MSLVSSNGTHIADVRVAGISGVKALGFSQLRFGVEFRTPDWPSGRQASLRSIRAAVHVGTDRSAFQFLGVATPERPTVIRTFPHANQETLSFHLELSQERIAAIEKLRNGGGLIFRLAAAAEAWENDSVWPATDDAYYEANLSEWSRVLMELGAVETLVVGIEIPTGVDSGPLKQAAELVRKAHGDLHRGQYDHVVAGCRKAIESVFATLGKKEGFDIALKKFAQGNKMQMSKLERELLVASAVRNYTHLAHHFNEDGAEEIYSRSDATFVLTLSAALVMSAAGQIDHAE